MKLNEKDSKETVEENLGGDVEENYEESDNSDSEKLKSEDLDKIKKELDVCKDRLLRTTAEYDNFRKRSEREKLQIYSHATSNAVLDMLPVADSLDLAEKSVEGSSAEYKKGLSMVKAQFSEALKKLGVESFGEVGEEFNPDLHNAVSHIEDEDSEKENLISEVFQKGYKLRDKVIRHAMVQVVN